VVLDELVVESERLSDLSVGDFRVRVTWTRAPSLIPQGIPVLRLGSRIPVESDSIPVLNLDTSRSDLNFQLVPGERVRSEVEFDLESPGVYLLTPRILGFQQGSPIEQRLPSSQFGWTDTTVGGFNSEDAQVVLVNRCIR
jgi:hypothetical protein